MSSHDAVVALVRAAAVAGSADPAKVWEAIPGLRLGTADGLAGPPLDFASTVAVPDDAVVTLAATSVSPGGAAAVGRTGPVLVREHQTLNRDRPPVLPPRTPGLSRPVAPANSEEQAPCTW